MNKKEWEVGLDLDREIGMRLFNLPKNAQQIIIPSYSSNEKACEPVLDWVRQYRSGFEIYAFGGKWWARYGATPGRSTHLLTHSRREHVICLAALQIYEQDCVLMKEDKPSVSATADAQHTVSPHEKCDKVIQDALNRAENLQEKLRSTEESRRFYSNLWNTSTKVVGKIAAERDRLLKDKRNVDEQLRIERTATDSLWAEVARLQGKLDQTNAHIKAITTPVTDNTCSMSAEISFPATTGAARAVDGCLVGVTEHSKDKNTSPTAQLLLDMGINLHEIENLIAEQKRKYEPVDVACGSDDQVIPAGSMVYYESADAPCGSQSHCAVADDVVANAGSDPVVLKKLLANWIDSAAMFHRNSDYWRGRAETAEKSQEVTPKTTSFTVDGKSFTLSSGHYSPEQLIHMSGQTPEDCNLFRRSAKNAWHPLPKNISVKLIDGDCFTTHRCRI